MPHLISQEEIENLPEDPQQRFVGIEALCRTRFEKMCEGETEWSIIQDYRLTYMTAVVGAARWLKISPISEIEVPKRSTWNDQSYEDFVAELGYYTVQLMLAGAERNSRTSIVLEGRTRDRLRTLTKHLRDEVNRLDLPPARIDRLLKHVDDFERALDAKRLTFAAVGILALAVASAVADVDGTTNVVRKLVGQVEEAVGHAKEEQEKAAAGNQLIAPDILQLVPPKRSAAAPSKPNELDDEIPF